MRKSILSVATVLISSALVLGAGPTDSLSKNSPNLFGSTTAAPTATTVVPAPTPTPVQSTPAFIKHSAKSHSKQSKHSTKGSKLSKKKHTKVGHKASTKKAHKKLAAKTSK